MKKIEFAHLHVHSDYSICESTASVMTLADRAEELGMKYLALTDYGVMFGVMDFLEACNSTIDEYGNRVPRKNPIHPVIGCEVYVSPGSRFDKKGTEKDNKFYHLILLASGRQGYLNLIKMCSLAHTEGFYYRPRVDDELLYQYNEGIIAISANIYGEISQLILEGKTDAAEKKACYYRDLFGEHNFYLELSDQGIPAGAIPGGLSQKDINKAIADISQRTGIPLVAANNIHYIKQEDAAAHDVLLCIGAAKKKADEDREKFYGDQFYFKTGEEMAALFSEYPEAIVNTIKIAERCIADIPKINLHDLPDYLPQFPVPKEFPDDNHYLCNLAYLGLAERYPGAKVSDEKWKKILERLDYELEFIIKWDFSNYFLIVADYVNWAREHNIPVGPGRGSAAGSITAYALRITDIDPIKYNLLFEQFINPERICMPDFDIDYHFYMPNFDIDFGIEGRDEVIKYISEKYGTDCVGRIIAFGKFNAKAVIRDVGRVLGISIKDCSFIAGFIPNDPGITLKKVITEEPKLQELKNDPRYAQLFGHALKLEGLHRHTGVHAAGLVIGKSALDTMVPLYSNNRIRDLASQYDMNHLTQCGLVKFDILGLKTLDVIERTEELVCHRGGEYNDFSIANIPEDDPATFKLFTEGNTDGIFQFESDGMKDILKQAKPETMTDLIAINSLYRPALMEELHQFIESKNKKQKLSWLDIHPYLEDILKETYGEIIYQEQIMQIIQRITGCSLGEANVLRRKMERGNNEKLEKEIENYLNSSHAKAIANDLHIGQTEHLFDNLTHYAAHSFNKAHATAYTKLAYQTAYLKANFPEEYMQACKEFT